MRGLGRFFQGDILICLPLVLLLVGGGILFAKSLPGFERREAERIESKYREIAQAIKDDEVEGVRTLVLDDRKSRGKLSRGQWGLARQPDALLVWYHPPSSPTVRAVAVEAILPFDYVGFFRWIGGAVLVLVVILTNVGLRSFRRFVRERDDFLAATAHDLTTPLVGLRRMIGRNDEEAKRLNERMILLVDNIKNFLRLGGRRKKPDLKPCDIAALCHEAYALFAADYEDSNSGPVIFQTPQTSQTPQTCVMADEALTLQTLWNLFGNDLKYAAPYGKVEVRVSSDEKNVIVEFVDEGPGMSPRQMRRAFDRYYRAKTVLETGKGGFGIGLCTAREFVRAMGGDLTVRPNAPKGCIFALALPRCS